MTDAVAALREGKPVVMPFDTVYGLAADPDR
jgi:tRNA A37 threonylcarbamoyladenosine synthetase subunit TsaC/SUA5/YrdC